MSCFQDILCQGFCCPDDGQRLLGTGHSQNFLLHREHGATNNFRERNELRDSTEISSKEIENLPLFLYFKSIRCWNTAVSFFKTLLSQGGWLPLAPSPCHLPTLTGGSLEARSSPATSLVEKEWFLSCWTELMWNVIICWYALQKSTVSESIFCVQTGFVGMVKWAARQWPGRHSASIVMQRERACWKALSLHFLPPAGCQTCVLFSDMGVSL